MRSRRTVAQHYYTYHHTAHSLCSQPLSLAVFCFFQAASCSPKAASKSLRLRCCWHMKASLNEQIARAKGNENINIFTFHAPLPPSIYDCRAAQPLPSQSPHTCIYPRGNRLSDVAFQSLSLSHVWHTPLLPPLGFRGSGSFCSYLAFLAITLMANPP